MPPVKKASGAGTARAPSNKTEKSGTTPAGHNEEVIRHFIWNVVSLNTHLEDIHRIWADLLGVSEPQWLILLAIDELDDGHGVPGTSVAAKIHIHPAFVTTQTKSLEKAGFLSRVTSPTDARFVLMSLTHKARDGIAKLAEHRKALNDSIFAGLDEKTLRDLNDRLTAITKNADKAARRLAVEN